MASNFLLQKRSHNFGPCRRTDFFFTFLHYGIFSNNQRKPVIFLASFFADQPFCHCPSASWITSSADGWLFRNSRGNGDACNTDHYSGGGLQVSALGGLFGLKAFSGGSGTTYRWGHWRIYVTTEGAGPNRKGRKQDIGINPLLGASLPDCSCPSDAGTIIRQKNNNGETGKRKKSLDPSFALPYCFTSNV